MDEVKNIATSKSKDKVSDREAEEAKRPIERDVNNETHTYSPQPQSRTR